MKSAILSFLVMVCVSSTGHAFIFASGENKFIYTQARIELPDGWIQNPVTDKMIENGFVLHLTSHENPSKGMVLKTIKRSDVADMASYVNSEKIQLEKKFTAPHVSELLQLTINGIPAWRYEVTDKSKGEAALTYSVTTFEGDKEIVVASVWGPVADASYEETFLKSVNSLTGLQLAPAALALQKDGRINGQLNTRVSTSPSIPMTLSSLKKAESTIGEKKLPLVSEVYGTIPEIPSELRQQFLYVDFYGSPTLKEFVAKELASRGYQIVEDRSTATVVLLGFGFFSSKWANAPRFGGDIGYLVEKSGGINQVEVDNFPECVGQSYRATSVSVDLGNVETLSQHGASTMGAAVGGVVFSTAINIIGEKTGLAAATRRGFSNLVGGGNLGLDNPVCLFGCDNVQSLTVRFVIAEQERSINLFRIDTSLSSRKHMPNEMLADALKHGLAIF